MGALQLRLLGLNQVVGIMTGDNNFAVKSSLILHTQPPVPIKFIFLQKFQFLLLDISR